MKVCTGQFVAFQSLFEHLHMHVTQTPDFCLGHPLFDELLLHGRHLARLDVLDELAEALPGSGNVPPFVQVGNDGLEHLNPMCGVGDGHWWHR
jgi:hypothetical protein